MPRITTWLLFVVGVAGCNKAPQVEPTPPPESKPQKQLMVDLGDKPKTFPGLHNVVRVSEKTLSGGFPEGDDGFDSLKQLGIKTIITVDGAKPDVKRAKARGMRYVHIPFGYDGVPREQGLKLARAVRDLPGPVYIHCHHGKHRSPAAAVVVERCLDGKCSADMAVAVLKRAGTSPHYTGLYEAANEFGAITKEELDNVPADFPEVVEPTDRVKEMVAVGDAYENLRVLRKNKWQAPEKHADLDSVHQAALLAQAYENCVDMPETKKDERLRNWMIQAMNDARELTKILEAGEADGKIDSAKAEAAYKKCGESCKTCHAVYRDVPRK